jgi:ribonuclease HI
MAKQMLQLGSTKNNEDTSDLEYRPLKSPKRQMNLGHCLNKHLSGTIDPKIGVEPICRTNPTITGKVIIQDRETATTNATQASMIPGNICTDGSRLETGEVGCAAVWLTNNGTWKKHQYHLGKKKEINDAELFAITEALKMANRYQIGDREMDTIHIYTDSMSALKRIQESTPTAGQWITKTIVEREKALSRTGWNTIYHGVPGHSKIAGNKNADHAAKEAAKGPNQNGVQHMSKAESFTSIAHLTRITKEKRTKELMEWIKSLVEGRTGYQAPEYQKPDPAAMTTTKRITTRYFQLKTTHALTGAHLKRIKTIDDDRCWWCNNRERQTVQHLLKDCKRWRQERRKLKKAMKPAVWNHINIMHLFANRKTTQDILEFLKNTEVGNRKTEKELWKQEEERDETWGWREEPREYKRKSEGNEEETENEDSEEEQEESDVTQNVRTIMDHGERRERRERIMAEDNG